MSREASETASKAVSKAASAATGAAGKISGVSDKISEAAGKMAESAQVSKDKKNEKRSTPCVLCGVPVGSKALKLNLDDLLICPECWKRASVLGVDLADITSQELSGLSARFKANLFLPVGEALPDQSADGMYDYCALNGCGTGFSRKSAHKHFKILQDNLLPDEKVLMAFIGKNDYVSVSEHGGNFAYAITDKRFIAGQHTMLGQAFQNVTLRHINDATFSMGLVNGIIVIDTEKVIYTIGIDKESALNVNNRIHAIFDATESEPETRPDHQSASVTPSSMSAADEILKYKQLLDLGALTQEEFDAKKKQLLAL